MHVYQVILGNARRTSSQICCEFNIVCSNRPPNV